MEEQARIDFPVRLDDLIDAIKKVHTDALEQLSDAVLDRRGTSAKSPIT